MNCPKCASSDVRHSRKNSWTDPFHLLLRRHAFRCRNCRLRFHASHAASAAPNEANARKRSEDPKRRRRRIRRWLWETALVAVLLVIFLAFLRFLTREPASGVEGSQVSIS